MATTTSSCQSAQSEQKPRIVDCDCHNLPEQKDLHPYLAPRWRDYLTDYGLRTPSEQGVIRARWMGSRTDAWGPAGEPPGSEPALVREQLLDRYGIDAVILNNIMASIAEYVGAAQPQQFTDALVAAGNDWAAAEWLQDERMFASVLLAHEHPASAVSELERWADDPRFVQALLPFRTRQPLGNVKYWPLIEAIVEHDMPLGLHPGNASLAPLTAAGWPSFYFEDHIGLPQALMCQIASLVCEGVFDRWPALRIVIQEGGWTWVAPFAWRFDRAWKDLRAEVPHLQRKPSEYIAEHFWFTTQPFEEPDEPAGLDDILEVFGRPDRLLFSSDYPHWDFDAPTEIARKLPDATRAGVMGANATAVYPTIAAALDRAA